MADPASDANPALLLSLGQFPLRLLMLFSHGMAKACGEPLKLEGTKGFRNPSSMLRVFAKDRIIAPPDYNRWLVPPASIAIHLCIGSVYAWSNFNGPLTKVRGVLASAPDDCGFGCINFGCCISAMA